MTNRLDFTTSGIRCIYQCVRSKLEGINSNLYLLLKRMRRIILHLKSNHSLLTPSMLPHRIYSSSSMYSQRHISLLENHSKLIRQEAIYYHRLTSKKKIISNLPRLSLYNNGKIIILLVFFHLSAKE